MIHSRAREPTNFSYIIVASPFTKLVKLTFQRQQQRELKEERAKHAVRAKIAISESWMMCGKQRFQQDTETQGFVLIVSSFLLLKSK
jgi:hypothetical protein